MTERSQKFSAVSARQTSAMIEPVESGNDGDRQIAHRIAGEFDHRVIMRQLAKIALQYRRLRVGFGEQPEFGPRHRQQIAHGFQPRVVADAVLVGAGIGCSPLAGWINPFSAVGVVEILPALFLHVGHQRMRRIRRRGSFREWPATPVHETSLIQRLDNWNASYVRNTT
jgi:hypothetical protein